jgi:hypothetical protein
VSSYSNYYSLAYLAHLLPLPRRTKEKLLSSTFGRFLSKIKVWIPLGNISASGTKL